MPKKTQVCPKCKNAEISYHVVQSESVAYTKGTSTVRKRGGMGCLYWALIGWWIWIFLLPFKLIRALFPHRGRKAGTVTHNAVTKTENTTETKAVCQNCGYTWTV